MTARGDVVIVQFPYQDGTRGAHGTSATMRRGFQKVPSLQGAVK